MAIPYDLYLDTDVLVSAVLESDPRWQQDNQGEYRKKADEIGASRKILLADYLYDEKPKTSLYAISEFISKGRREDFGKKTFAEMFDLVSQDIFSRCEVVNAELHEEGLPKIDSQWEKYWMFARVRCDADAVDRKSGQPSGAKDFDFVLSLTKEGIGSVKGISGFGSPKSFGNIKIVRFNTIDVSAPAFEILLFTRASEIANKYDIHLGDALHVLYAQGNAECILTNDAKFYKKWDNNPNFSQESGVQVRSAVSFVQECQYRGYL